MSVLSQHHFYPKWLPLSSFHHYVEPVTLALLTHALPVKQQESFVALRLTFTQLLPPPLDRTQHCIGFVSASLCECQGVIAMVGRPLCVLRDDLFELLSKHDPKSQQVITEIEICHLADIYIQCKRSHRSNSGLNALLKGRMALQRDCDLSKIPSQETWYGSTILLLQYQPDTF